MLVNTFVFYCSKSVVNAQEKLQSFKHNEPVFRAAWLSSRVIEGIVVNWICWSACGYNLKLQSAVLSDPRRSVSPKFVLAQEPFRPVFPRQNAYTDWQIVSIGRACPGAAECDPILADVNGCCPRTAALRDPNGAVRLPSDPVSSNTAVPNLL